MVTLGQQLGTLLRSGLQRATPSPEGEALTGSTAPQAFVPGHHDLSTIAQDVVAKAAQEAEGMPAASPKAMISDPWQLVTNLGYKDRPHPVTYTTIRQVIARVTILPVVLQTRVVQVSAFGQCHEDRFRTGHSVKKRRVPGQKERAMTRAEQKEAHRIEEALQRGTPANISDPKVMGHRMFGGLKDLEYRYSFTNMLKALILDSLSFDQCCLEVVPDKYGKPAMWLPVDATTIRLAYHGTPYHEGGLTPRTVQLRDSVPTAQWDAASMGFFVRNPSTNQYLHGYGTSEIEMVLSAVTAILHAWEYNQNFFQQGTAPKGILNIKGMVPDRQLSAFRRFWHSMLTGSQNAWKTPITNAEGLEWVNLGASAREMEFSHFFDFLIKIVCGIFQMDPAEINFHYGSSGASRVMFESAPMQKLTESRAKGLTPLMAFLAEMLNKMIVHPLNPDFTLKFSGLDAHTPEELADLYSKQVQSTHTVNELRETLNLPSLENGDVILNTMYLQQSQMSGGGDDSFFNDLGDDYSDNADADADAGGDGLPSATEEYEAEETEKSIIKKTWSI